MAKSRVLHRVSGPGVSNVYGVHNNNLENVRRGLYERVLYRVAGGEARLPPTPMANVFESRLGTFRRRLASVCATIRPVTREQFTEMYSGRKRCIYQKATESLAARPLNLSDSYLSTFVKCEKINFHTKSDPAPRVIQPRSPRYNVEVGRYLKLAEKAICRAIAEVWGGATVMKGMNAEEVGCAMRVMWDQFHDPVAIDLDATRFDQHVSVAALTYEHSVYLACTSKHDRPKLARLLAMQLRNRGFARTPDGIVKYDVAGRRMSGDINTGLGNCLLMSAMVWGLCRSLGIRARLANNGDDCVLIMERTSSRRVLGNIDGYFKDFGFVMEVGSIVDQFEKLSFCQTHPVYDGERWLMVRDPRTSVDKDLVTVIDISDHQAAKKWIHAIGECGLALTAGLPIQSFYSLLMRNGVAGQVSDHPWMDGGFLRMRQGGYRLDRKVHEPHPECRASYWRAFGVLPDLQVAMEREWDRMSLILSAGETVNQLNPLAHIFA